MRDTLTVTEINRYIKDMFDNNQILYNVIVKGEVSNFKESHGNYYFNLKDENSTIRALMFGNDTSTFDIQDGMNVVVTGRITVYEKNGTYAIYVNKIENDGIGDFYLRLAELKKKLFDMGMFDASYKKEIPKYSMNIGVVTAKDGAAIKDIVKTIKNKNRCAKIYLYPSFVQGENAYKSIIDGIMTLDKMNLDVIIIGRGGGSIEDLYCFNDERVAYAIFNAKTPIISAVGHEINDSISDFVADARAATPTAAGELATFDYDEFVDDIENYKLSLKKILDRKVLDLRDMISEYREHIELLAPKSKIKIYKNKYEHIRERLNDIMRLKISYYRNRCDKYIGDLKLKNATMTTYVNDKKIDSIKDVKVGDKILTRVRDGIIYSKVEKVKGIK